LKCLGFDPSLTNFGWALHDTSASGQARCVARGRFQTSAKTLYIDRYVDLRERVRALVRELKPDRMGIEYPVFNDLFSEGLYGLFLYTSEALRLERQDVVFWSPLQVKAHARDSIVRPPKWKMDKPDMIEAARKDTGKGVWNHNEADAYLVARLSARFWQFYEGDLSVEVLTETEQKFFVKEHTFTKGKRAGETVRSGVLYREDDRFFQWSQTQEVDDGQEASRSIQQPPDAGARSEQEDPQE
jgi:hypothetical protein